MPDRPATTEYRTWAIDGRLWNTFQPCPGDVVIATYPKSGTTWMQRIVGALLLGSPEPFALSEASPWVDSRLWSGVGRQQARPRPTGRRFLKSHLPADGLPLFEAVRYIHVGREGRDCCLSLFHHCRAYREQVLAALDAAGIGDPAIRRAYPRPGDDPAAFFHRWLTEGSTDGASDGLPSLSWFAFERSWWAMRDAPNVLLVHYADLKADLAGEMRRIAGFLDVPIAESTWPALVEAAGFAAMSRDASILMGPAAAAYRNRSSGFFRSGTGGGHGVLDAADLALFERRCAEDLPPALAGWLAGGHRAARVERPPAASSTG